MAVVTTHSDFGAQENKICYSLQFSPFYLPDAMTSVFWMLSFNQLFHAPLLPSSRDSVVPLHSLPLEWYHLRLMIFHLAILIPVCNSFSSAFNMMCSAYNLSKYSDKYIFWCTPFPILKQFVVLCPVLIVASLPSYKFQRKQVRWSSNRISSRIFQFVVIHTVKGFCIVNEAEVDVFLEFPCFFIIQQMLAIWFLAPLPFLNPAWTSGNSWFTVKHSLKDFEHNLVSMWNECNCVVVWTFFGIAFLWDWNENWPFPVLWPLLSFPNLLAYWVQHFHSIIF